MQQAITLPTSYLYWYDDFSNSLQCTIKLSTAKSNGSAVTPEPAVGLWITIPLDPDPISISFSSLLGTHPISDLNWYHRYHIRFFSLHLWHARTFRKEYHNIAARDSIAARMFSSSPLASSSTVNAPNMPDHNIFRVLRILQKISSVLKNISRRPIRISDEDNYSTEVLISTKSTASIYETL